MTIDILVKSYLKDFKLLKYSLESLKLNVTGYQNVIVVIPQKDLHTFWANIRLYDLPKNTVIKTVNEYGNGYLFQQVCKLKAYEYSSADYIMFSDSDIIFDRKIDISVNDKPEILYTDYLKVGDAICWKKPTENIMQKPIEFEFMRRNNLIYHRSTLENIAKWQPNLEHIVMSSNIFSEFNLMGSYAFEFERDKYNFVNTDNWQYTPPLGTQLWGWAEKDNTNEPHPYEYARSLKVINSALGLNLTEL